MNFRRLVFSLLPWFLLIVLLVFWIGQCTTERKEIKEEKVVINHHMVLEKVVNVGKLELVKFFIKDIMDHKVEKEWWFDAKVVLLVSGEAAGCIDLTHIDSTDIRIEPQSITIKLPQPELCYFKVNHEESKVYDLEHATFEEAELVDEAYKAAEKGLKEAALKMKILDKTKANAEEVLRPLLENFTGKQVKFVY